MSKDQYKYFRIEARELLDGLSEAILELERGSAQKETVARLLRLAHTLKGASRVVKQTEIADLAHRLEDIFGPFRDGRKAIPNESNTAAFGLLDGIAAKIASLDAQPAESKREPSRVATEEEFPTVRVEIEEMDRLLEGVAEASVQLSTVRRGLDDLDRARQLAGSLLDGLDLALKNEGPTRRGAANGLRVRSFAEDLRAHLERLGRNLSAGIDQVDVEFAQVRDAANRLRLLPAAAVFPALERAARDAAQTLSKEVAIECHGGANRLDTHVLGGLRNALLHMVRNAVAHGIEHPRDRLAAKKPAAGRIEVRVEQRGTRVSFICRDDGRGIDIEAVRRVAARAGLVSASDAASLGLEEAVNIIMTAGVTTTAGIDEVSGRGIGLDVVRETAARLKGEVSVRSERGQGTVFEIKVPMSLSSVAALEVEAAGVVASLPLDCVRQTTLLADREIVHGAEGDSIVYNDAAIPFLTLSRVLRQKEANGSRRFWSAVVFEGAEGVTAIGVDRLLGTSSIVLKPLPSLAVAESIVAGASLTAEGDPQLVLDPDAVATAVRMGRECLPENAPRKRPSVLVIDDSLTTRMLEQSILESAGYDVEVATSGEEGLEKARSKPYSLFLVDVEMPGMDGFDFVSQTRADARLSAVPSILVTSRSGVEDRRRGEEVGARAYIVKGEFDQSYLLRKARELIG